MSFSEMTMGLFSVSVLKSLHSNKDFSSADEVHAFERALAEALEGGRVERIPVGKLLSHVNPEEWYRDVKTGAVFRFVPPEFPFRGTWAKVENPEERSFFEQLCPAEEPNPEQYTALLQKLDDLWRSGIIERAVDTDRRVPSQLFHHRPTDETFELVPPAPPFDRATWWKLFRSSVRGSWPGELTLLKPESE